MSAPADLSRDYASRTYLNVTLPSDSQATSSLADFTSPNPASGTAVVYHGPVGTGLLSNEHVLSLPKTESVENAKGLIRQKFGEGVRIEEEVPKKRNKKVWEGD